MQWQRILVLVCKQIQWNQRNRLRFLKTKIATFPDDYVHHQTQYNDVKNQSPWTLERRHKVDFLALQPPQLGMIRPKEAKTIPKHQRQPIQFLLKLFPFSLLFLFMLPLTRHLTFQVRAHILFKELIHINLNSILIKLITISTNTNTIANHNRFIC